MVNLDEEIAQALEARASSEKRPMSNYIAILIEQDLRDAGLLPGSEQARAELLALGEELGLEAALETLRRKLRTAKPAA